ncbi:MAG TPA: hypothetical protein DDW76_14585 [Cyanobacteria bacterium UBA11369]|nr:hypothetical protein [Cyanobacteria bacterium UBA11369]
MRYTFVCVAAALTLPLHLPCAKTLYLTRLQAAVFQLAELVDKTHLSLAAQKLLDLTYVYSPRDLAEIIPNFLAQLPGGEDWKAGRR